MRAASALLKSVGLLLIAPAAWIWLAGPAPAQPPSTLNAQRAGATPLASAQVRARLLSIEDFGATPDDPASAARNVAAINRALQACGRDYYLPLIVPGRAYYINDTIEIPKRTGYALIGNGGGSQVHEVEHKENKIGGPQSRLVWSGPPDRPMVRYRGAGLYWQGVQLHGRPKDSDAPKAAIGLLVENGQNALGTGKINAPYFAAFQCRAGIQFGSEWAADNGDVSQFGRLHIADCDVGMKVVGRLSQEFVIQYVRNQRCGVVFDFDGGGELHVYGGQTLGRGGTLLRLGNVNPESAAFRIQGWHVDRQGPGTSFKLLEMTQQSWADVTIQAHLPSHEEYPTPIANVIGPTRLRLEGCYGLQAGSVVCRSHRSGSPVVIVDGCRLKNGVTPESLIDAQESRGRWSVVCRDCYSHVGKLFPDYRESP